MAIEVVYRQPPYWVESDGKSFVIKDRSGGIPLQKFSSLDEAKKRIQQYLNPFMNGRQKAEAYLNTKAASVGIEVENDSRPYVAYKSPNGTDWFVGRGGMGSSTGHRFKTEAEAKKFAADLNDKEQAKRDHDDWAEDRKAALARGEVRRGVRGY